MNRESILALWDEHQRCEFELRDVELTLATMSEDPHILNVPVMVGGRGPDGVRHFYRDLFLRGIPSDMEVEDFSCTVDADHLVAERNLSFTHETEMPWILPGIEPTGRRVEVPHVVIVGIEDGKVDSEHIFWDQGSVLAQVGLIASDGLPVYGSETAAALAATAEQD
jgi:carboxymethylenebutenolidase